jgi:hypothetical protein
MLTTAPAFPAAECHHVSQCVCAGGGNGFLRRAQCIPSGHVMAKNQHGERQPYLPTRKWVDGSIADDLPAKRLQCLYSTNHVDLGSRRGLPGFVPGRMTGLPPEFYTLKRPNGCVERPQFSIDHRTSNVYHSSLFQKLSRR